VRARGESCALLQPRRPAPSSKRVRVNPGLTQEMSVGEDREIHREREESVCTFDYRRVCGAPTATRVAGFVKPVVSSPVVHREVPMCLLA